MRRRPLRIALPPKRKLPETQARALAGFLHRARARLETSAGRCVRHLPTADAHRRDRPTPSRRNILRATEARPARPPAAPLLAPACSSSMHWPAVDRWRPRGRSVGRSWSRGLRPAAPRSGQRGGRTHAQQPGARPLGGAHGAAGPMACLALHARASRASKLKFKLRTAAHCSRENAGRRSTRAEITREINLAQRSSDLHGGGGGEARSFCGGLRGDRQVKPLLGEQGRGASGATGRRWAKGMVFICEKKGFGSSRGLIAVSIRNMLKSTAELTVEK